MSALPPQVDIDTERARAYLISQGFAEGPSLCAVSQVYASASFVLALPTRSERLTSQAAVAAKALTDGARCCERTNGWWLCVTKKGNWMPATVRQFAVMSARGSMSWHTEE